MAWTRRTASPRRRAAPSTAAPSHRWNRSTSATQSPASLNHGKTAPTPESRAGRAPRRTAVLRYAGGLRPRAQGAAVVRRTVLLTAFVLALLAGWGALRAQTVTSDDLAAAALTADDLPGYQFASESVTPPPTGFDATYARIFSSDQNGGAILVDALLLPGDAVPIDALATVLGRDTLFRGLASALQIPVSNFRLTGPLGIGDSDQSAVWEGSDPNSGQPLVFYADGFLRGRLLAFILY